jgi:hypothetical protein
LFPAHPAGNLISTVPTKAIRGDQFTVKIDHRLNDKQNLSIYYYFNDDRTLQPFLQLRTGGRRCPRLRRAFGGALPAVEHYPHLDISNSTVNEFRFNYNREGQGTFQHPQNTELVQSPALRLLRG